jgi:hypothetical protein
MPTPQRNLTLDDTIHQTARLIRMAFDSARPITGDDRKKLMARALRNLSPASLSNLMSGLGTMAFDAAIPSLVPKGLKPGVDEEQPHDLEDFVPGVDAPLSDPSMGNKMRWLLKKLAPEEFCQWLDMELNGTEPPVAEDSDDYIPGVGHLANPPGAKDDLANPRFTARPSAMDAAIKASNGFASRWGGRLGSPYPVSDSTATHDLRVDDAFRFTRRAR